MPPDQFFSLLTAAQLLGLPLPLKFSTDTTLHVTAFEPARPPRMAGVVGHHVHPDSVRTVVRGGLRLDEVMEESWRVIRINKSHLRRPAVIDYKIRTALLAAGWRP